MQCWGLSNRLLTPSSLLDLLGSLDSPGRSLLLLLLRPAPVEVLHDDTDEHVEDEEAHQEQEGDEVEKTPLVVVLSGLLVDADRIQTVVHDVHPTILGGEDEQGHEGSAEIVKIVLLVQPAVVFVLETLLLVGDVHGYHVWAIAVEEQSFKELKIKKSNVKLVLHLKYLLELPELREFQK